MHTFQNSQQWEVISKPALHMDCCSLPVSYNTMQPWNREHSCQSVHKTSLFKGCMEVPLELPTICLWQKKLNWNSKAPKLCWWASTYFVKPCSCPKTRTTVRTKGFMKLVSGLTSCPVAVICFVVIFWIVFQATKIKQYHGMSSFPRKFLLVGIQEYLIPVAILRNFSYLNQYFLRNMSNV